MFCPQCSQAQVNPALKFCSRCGFPLAGVTALLEKQGQFDDPASNQPSPVKQGVRQGILIVIFGFLLAALTSVLGQALPIPRQTSEIFAALGFFLGIMRIVSATVFPSPHRSMQTLAAPREFGNAPAPGALPEPQTRPISVDAIRPPDGQMPVPVPVPSVTEETTRHLR